MGWDRRGNRRFYYRGQREGRRVRRIYLGNGPLAELAARADEQRRAERQERARVWRELEAGWGAADLINDRLDHASEILAEAALTRAGYHRHDRGSWRRRRMALKEDKPEAGTGSAHEVQRVLERAQQGDRAVLPELTRMLDTNPQVWLNLGDLAAHAERAWVGLAAGPDLALGESLCRKLAALKAELAGPTPSPLERLLVDRVAACWIQTHYADAVAGQAKGRDLTPAQLDHLIRRQERAQRSYLAAIRSLATVRKLLPTAEVTIAPGKRQAVGAPTGTRPDQGDREGRAARPEETPATATKEGRPGRPKAASKGRSRAAREASIPKVLRDLLHGLVATEN
jgi:hypothetical protein